MKAFIKDFSIRKASIPINKLRELVFNLLIESIARKLNMMEFKTLTSEPE